MELRISTELQPQEIIFNYDELISELSERLNYYNNLVITEDSIQEGKADRAKLNKLRTALETRRKEIKKQCLAPYEAFESKYKEIIALIDEPITVIDSQLKEYDARRKEEKREQIMQIYDEVVPEYVKDYISLSRIWDTKWQNVSVSLESIRNEIIAASDKVANDLQAIERLNPEYIVPVKLKYAETLGLGAALKYCDTLAQSVQASAQAPKQNQPTENMAEVQKPSEAPQEAPVSPANEEKLYRLRLGMRLTMAQWEILKKCLEDNNIIYERI